MTELTYFTVAGDFRSVIADLETDFDTDPNISTVTANVTFKPMISDGDLILATQAEPRPTAFAAATITGRIDTDGQLKLRPLPDGTKETYVNLAAFPATGSASKYYQATNTGKFYRWTGSTYTEILGFVPVRLLADTPVLELADPLYYSVTFTNVLFNGKPGTIKGFNFQAPTSDTTLNLVEVARQPGNTASGITKVAPGAVRLENGNLVFSFAGADIPDPVPFTPAFSLDEVTDASDLGKDIVQAVNAAAVRGLIGAEEAAQKGMAGGYAPLNASAQIDSAYLPAYVDDVLETATESAFPVPGEQGKIYVARDTGDAFRWSGTSYIRISDRVTAAGITDSTTVGRAVVTASDQAAARTAIGAGTSSLVLGTTAGTAKEGTYTPTSSEVTTALGYTPEDAADKGQANGYASLDANALVPVNQIPAFTTDTVAEGSTNKYFTDQRAQSALTVQLAGKANTSHTHAQSDITGLSTSLAGKSDVGHGHTQSDVSGLTAALDGKSNVGHSHSQSDVTGLTSALAGKEPTLTAGTSSQYYRGDKTWATLNVSAVSGAEATANRGQANGYATLDSGGKVPVSQLPNSVMEYQGTYNASTQTPALTDATGNAGDVYRVSAAGTVNFGSGNIQLRVGDYIIYSGSQWQRSATTDSVASIAGLAGDISSSSLKTALSLDLVDNTADANKNVLSASKLTTPRNINGVAFDGTANITVADSTKEPAITAGTTAQYFRGDKTFQTLDKSAVGLGNVDNTSDATKNSAAVTLTNKTISGASNTISNIAQSSVTNLTTDLAAKENTANKGIANGYASLDATGKLPTSQLPSSLGGNVVTSVAGLTGDVSANSLKSALSLAVTSSVTAQLGDGVATSIVVNHNLNTRNIITSVRRSSNYAEVECDVFATTLNSATFTFATAPAVNEFFVTIIADGTGMNGSVFYDNSFIVRDDADTTKAMQFQLSGITTGTTRTLTVPNASTTLVGHDTSQTLSNKIISGASNTISNVPTTALVLSGAQSKVVGNNETTTSTSFTDLATTGDQVTVTIGASGMALVSISALGNSDTHSYGAVMGYAISGATTAAASDYGTTIRFGGTGSSIQLGRTMLATGLNPGSTTFKLKYKAEIGTARFSIREIVVVPL